MAGKFVQGDIAALQKELQAATQEKSIIRVGMSTCGIAAGAAAVLEKVKNIISEKSLDIEIKEIGCNGMCYAEPLVEFQVQDQPRAMYGNLTAESIEEILLEYIDTKKLSQKQRVTGVEGLGYEGLAPESCIQKRVVLRNCGIIDPSSLDDYIEEGGYQGLERALYDLGSEGIINELKDSGLRGRGGAGFPTWMKWSFMAKEQAEEKFMICNADEGDPGAYMDRSVLESDPHSVIEGMIIAGLAVGATSGFLYIRAEYPLAIERIGNAIVQARRKGLLGKKILGTDFNYSLEVRLGAGAFVCGEETALMASIEGKRGTPTPRPPFPAEKGLWGMPSNINNVETLANIAPIVSKGGKWFAGYGTEKSAGTKVFAVTGKVQNSGLVEIPMGTSIKDIVMGIGGGVEGDHTIKAIQTGGPSGGVIPSKYFDSPVSYESLQELGSIMGSGGMIVMDERDNMLDITRFYLGFCVEESCGKCAPCRIGGTQMLRLLDKIADGKASKTDIATIRRLAHAMQKASLCGLGQTAANPVLSALRYYEEEFSVKLIEEAEVVA